MLAAHALASAERFEELLALTLMTLGKVEPHAYQIETARRVLRFFRGRALLADEVGLGKTVEALMILREYQLRGAVRRALVIVPPALLGQWVGELTEKAGIVPRTTEGAALRADPEGFWRGEGVVVASLATARSPRHIGAVQAEPWDLVIVDEAHHVKNRGTSSFKLVDGVKSWFLLLLTATPIETYLEELYNLVTLLKPGQFATPAAFRAQFVDRKDPLAPRNRERLRGLLAEVMVRNTRADSGLALPPRYVSTVAVDALPEERALYEAVVAFLRAHAGDAKARMLGSTLLLEAGSSPAAVRGTVARAIEAREEAGKAPELRAALAELGARAAKVRGTRKAKALVDLVKAHPDQVLVFTRFRETLGDLERVLREAGVSPLAFHGGMGAEAKRAALGAFREGGKVLLATDVGGEGQNLHHCHVLVNFDLPYNPMLIEQRIGRLHRMGQKEEVRVYNLCAKGTAEERVLDLLDRRLHLFELVVGEMDMVLGNLADERDLEERIPGAVRGEPERGGDRSRVRRDRGGAGRGARALRAGEAARRGPLREGLRGVSSALPDALGFVVEALEAEGALCEVDEAAEGAVAILPAGAARRLEVPEEARLALRAGHDGGPRTPRRARWTGHPGGGVRAGVAADGEARGRGAGAVSGGGAAARGGSAAAGARARAGGAVRAAERPGRGGAGDDGAPRCYAVAYVAYAIEADDRREGLVRVVTGADGGEPDEGVQGRLDLAWPESALRVVADGGAVGEAPRWIAARGARAVRAAAVPLVAEVARRHRRDHERIAAYFAALIAEARAPRRRTEKEAVEAKVAHLLAERDKKLVDLRERFAVKARASLAAVAWAEVPAAQVSLKLRRRKEAREITLRVPAGATSVDRPACEGCGAPAGKPAACDDRLHLLCEACAPNAQGRLACPACARRP